MQCIKVVSKPHQIDASLHLKSLPKRSRSSYHNDQLKAKTAGASIKRTFLSSIISVRNASPRAPQPQKILSTRKCSSSCRKAKLAAYMRARERGKKRVYPMDLSAQNASSVEQKIPCHNW